MLDLVELALNLIDLLSVKQDLLLQVLSLLAHINNLFLELRVVHVGHLLVMADILVDKANSLLVKVALPRQLINIVPQGIVLLLSLNERSHNFVNVGNA